MGEIYEIELQEMIGSSANGSGGSGGGGMPCSQDLNGIGVLNGNSNYVRSPTHMGCDPADLEQDQL